MNELKIFTNSEFGDIRTTIINNEPFLMLNDVCEILGIKNVSDAKGRLLPFAGKNNSLFEIKECKNDKTEWAGPQTLITPKGRETFRLLCMN